MISRPTNCYFTLPFVACAALLLAACDSASTVGGAAGDADSAVVGDADDPNDSDAIIAGDTDAAIALLAPFAGIYDLQNNWYGQSGDAIVLDEAFFVIEDPGADGISPAALYDFDDFDNCVPQRPSTGDVYKDLLSDRIFMDGIFEFNEAELFLSNSTLTIEFNDDTDFDNDGSTLDRVSVTAVKLGISQVSDLGETCS